MVHVQSKIEKAREATIEISGPTNFKKLSATGPASAQQEVSKVVVQIEEVPLCCLSDKHFLSKALSSTRRHDTNRLFVLCCQTRKRRIKAFIRADLVRTIT
jgi:hypothetical protein